MLTIYSVPVASYCAKLRIILRNKNIIFNELPPPGGYGSNEYRKIIPSGNLPAMIHNGFMLSDSESIAEYLDEFFPSIPMMPNAIKLRAKAREFSRSHDTRLEPAVRKLYPEVEFSTRNIESVELTGFEISKQLAALALLLSKNPLDTDKLYFTLTDVSPKIYVPFLQNVYHWHFMHQHDISLSQIQLIYLLL